MLGGRVGETAERWPSPHPSYKTVSVDVYMELSYLRLTKTSSAMLAGVFGSSSFSGGVGGGSKAIVFGEMRVEDPCASPRRLAARRSPDTLRSVRRSVDVEERLLVTLPDRN